MQELLLVLYLGTSFWVFFDAQQQKKRHQLPKGPGGNSPLLWLVASLLAWIVIFPLYIVKRGEANTQSSAPHVAGQTSDETRRRSQAAPDHSAFWRLAVYVILGAAALVGMFAIAWFSS